ncbi:hypothetical protein LR48_Vigan10g054500 [Vigna angularis]|uniref:Uncharacterized protein n=1 Tax=Phaseolus angularis TaxID=3914 RepID=A0A0L9VI42_PHAAN|nr:hypothetical protein LR48_Vigan10g054500 [Vigna angularis]
MLFEFLGLLCLQVAMRSDLDCLSNIKLHKLGVNEDFMMVAQRRRHHGVRRVPAKTKFAMALRFAWINFFFGVRFRIVALVFVAIGDDNLHERLVMAACVRMKLKGKVVEVVEEDKRVVKE